MNATLSDDPAFAAMLREVATAFAPPAGLKDAIRGRVIAAIQEETGRGKMTGGPLSLALGTRRRRRLVLALPLVAASVAALVLLWPKPERLTFAASVERAEKAMQFSVRSVHAVGKTTTTTGERTYQQWYKQPGRFRLESHQGRVTIDDGTRQVTFDSIGRVVIQVKASVRVDKTLPHLRMTAFLREVAGEKTVTIKAATDAELDGVPCARYDVWMPERQVPTPTKPRTIGPLKSQVWFGKAEGLMRRVVNRSGPGFKEVTDTTMTYNIDLPDDLFVVPADLSGWPPEQPPKLVITVVDAEERPVRGATVYVGGKVYYERHETDDNGRVEKTYPKYSWSADARPDAPRGWITSAMANDYFVAEPADRGSCDVFSTKGLRLHGEHGFWNPLAHRYGHAVPYSLVVGRKKQLRYVPDERIAYLRLQLRRKGAVKGRFVDPSGKPFPSRPFYVLPLLFVRPGTGPGSYAMYGHMRTTPEPPKERRPGEPYPWYDRFWTRCAEDGRFSVEVPAGHPFKLSIQPMNGLRPRTFPLAGPGQAEKPPPAKALKPGKVRDIGDITMPSK